MPTPDLALPQAGAKNGKFNLMQRVKPYLAPYYLAIAGLLGAATVVFTIIIVLLILVAANFNVLGLIE